MRPPTIWKGPSASPTRTQAITAPAMTSSEATVEPDRGRQAADRGDAEDVGGDRGDHTIQITAASAGSA